MMLGARHELALSARYPIGGQSAWKMPRLKRGLARLPRCSYRALKTGAWLRSSTQGASKYTAVLEVVYTVVLCGAVGV